MKIIDNADLTELNTFSVPAHSRYLANLDHPDQCYQLAECLQFQQHPVLILGGGSNVLFVNDFDGLVVLNRIPGRQILDSTDKHAYVRLFAGENWHDSVLWTLQQGLSGLENLSLIPGQVGAAPIQNIGAYGVELSDVLELVEVWDREENEFRMLNKKVCQFAYRDSIFKHQPDRYIVINITLKLSWKAKLSLRYPGLREALKDIANPTPLDVSKAVCNIRQAKLPDPKMLGNAGSFFKNPIINQEQAQALLASHPDAPNFPDHSGKVKLSAAWLIEQCDWKGYRKGDAGVSEQHALVLVNHGQASGQELYRLAMEIQQSVVDKFNIRLEPEPRIV